MKNPFYICDQCGETVDWYHHGGLCKKCGGSHSHPLKELYVVSSEREKDVLDSAFRTLKLSGYEIAVLETSNEGRLLDDEIVFATIGHEAGDIQKFMRLHKGYTINGVLSPLKFFSTDFSSYDRVVVVHAGGIRGMLMKYVLSYRFLQDGLTLCEMDLSYAGVIMVKSGYANCYTPDSLHGMFGFVVAASNPTAHVTELDVQWHADQWTRLTRNQTGLCICDGTSVINAPVTIYDSSLIEAAAKMANTSALHGRARTDNVIPDFPKSRVRNPVDASAEAIALHVHARAGNVTLDFLKSRVWILAREGTIILANDSRQ